MTREEAISKLVRRHPMAANNELFVERLEALGLLKFDPVVVEKKAYIFFPHPDGAHKLNVSVHLDDAITTLRRYNYVVEKKKDQEPKSLTLTTRKGESHRINLSEVEEKLKAAGYKIIVDHD